MLLTLEGRTQGKQGPGSWAPPGLPVPVLMAFVDAIIVVARGLNNREIAPELMPAERAVKNHVSSLLRKLNARDRTVPALRPARPFGQDGAPE